MLSTTLFCSLGGGRAAPALLLIKLSASSLARRILLYKGEGSLLKDLRDRVASARGRQQSYRFRARGATGEVETQKAVPSNAARSDGGFKGLTGPV